MKFDGPFVVVVEFDFPIEDSFVDYDSWARLVAGEVEDRLGPEVRVVRSHDHLQVSLQAPADYLLADIEMLLHAVKDFAPADVTVRIHEMAKEPV